MLAVNSRTAFYERSKVKVNAQITSQLIGVEGELAEKILNTT